MLLKEKTAVITGCNRGIGKSILEIFAKNQSNIFGCVRKIDDDFKKLVEELKKKYNVNITPVEIDLSNVESIDLGVKKIQNNGIPIDILVNNAGVIENSIFQMTSMKNLKSIFEINFFNQTKFTQLILKQIIKNKKGSIIYISSSSGLDNNYGRNAYSSSKAAVISQAQTLSREIGIKQIRVNTIAPGLTDTNMMNENTPKEILEKVVKQLSLGRIASPDEIANVALFLASDLSSYLTGQTIRVDGGM